MIYYGGKELAAAFRTVRNNTIKIAEEIPEDKYDFRFTPDTRSVQQTLAHIAVSTGFQDHVHSNKVTDLKTVNFMELMQRFSAEEKLSRARRPRRSRFLKSEGDKFAAFLESLPEPFLSETGHDAAERGPGDARSRFEMLLSPKEHEMHHRGQLMAMQRMIGLVPHLTRQFQERMAAQAAQAAAAQAAR